MPLPRLALAACLTFAAAPALADDAASRARREAEGYLSACLVAGAEAQDCDRLRGMFVEAYQLAKHGDYQGQRNTAYMLGGGADTAVQANPIHACAWRIVIAQAGHAQVNQVDTTNRMLACDKLKPAERDAASARAAALLSEIRRDPAPKPPPYAPPIDFNAPPRR